MRLSTGEVRISLTKHTSTRSTQYPSHMSDLKFDAFDIFVEKKLESKLSFLPEEPQKAKSGTVRYKPHNAGGYAVSRAFSSKVRRAPNDLRALAREYLLEHLRRGWPYNDEFYRTYRKFRNFQISKNFCTISNLNSRFTLLFVSYLIPTF